MGIQTKMYDLKPQTIQAIEVTEENIDELAKETEGTVTRYYAQSPIDRPTKAILFFKDDIKLRDVTVSVGGYLVYNSRVQDGVPYWVTKEAFEEVYRERPEQFIHEEYSK